MLGSLLCVTTTTKPPRPIRIVAASLDVVVVVAIVE